MTGLNAARKLMVLLFCWSATMAYAAEEPNGAQPPPQPAAQAQVGENEVSPEQIGAEAEAAADAPATELSTQSVEVADADPSALTDFSEELEPYGHWVEHPAYGTVWLPDRQVVGSDFAPYVSRGHWALTTDEQWIWVSDYPFGWVVFHYGRWVWASDSGWVWIPGRRYAHAWVDFRVGTAPYVGWAPRPPRYIWRAGVAVWIGSVPAAPFVFVPASYVFYPRVHTYIIHEHWRVRHLVRRSVLYKSEAKRS